MDNHDPILCRHENMCSSHYLMLESVVNVFASLAQSLKLGILIFLKVRHLTEAQIYLNRLNLIALPSRDRDANRICSHKIPRCFIGEF